MPGLARFSLLFVAYPTITAAIVSAFRRLQYPFFDRIISQPIQVQFFHRTAASALTLTAPASAATATYASPPNIGSTTTSLGNGANNKPASGAGFSYLISPSFHPKNRKSANGKIRQRKNGRPDSGEDCYFFTKIRDSDSVALGVIDGVGGWNEIGVDATDFSHTLAETMTELTSKLVIDSAKVDPENQIASDYAFPPLVLLDAAYTAVKSSGEVKAGGSTACVGVAHSNGTLQAANLGDSGFFIFRDGKLHYMSDPQTHFFNAPYQLAIIPQQIIEENARRGGKNFDDKPSDASLSTHKLKHGDVVVFVTDGILDNLAPQDCLRIVSEEMVLNGNWIVDRRSGDIHANASDKQYTGVDSLARRIVGAAFKASIDPKTDGPFAKEAQRQVKVLYKGGKPDDITAVVMFVQQSLGGRPQDKL
ncbi:phosphatase 2C-like domain-containing protein [Kockiozyma suomiensis]|uniref:phosphatase 2C-like domain-containing protein n=1 Tax=Kockiozyma suomiensis TaxID=1337062 RepID=UPI00334385C5